ncbi:MAG: PTS N-acetylgalactosamine transporter subunit IIB [Atopobiaceae bacterium]|jgi:PTS system galactosamine-specific IIB component|nr:PTS N-acetylgalactosamine transporter subunit IIB [Atopobiaceae bacterium]MCI2172654.1 PTS N-acetylgalactosamine transporter subunit IIB [Atopobiaceae bacterium]MCI2206961.1 PTS N-acetylgalactosamine transporter subunit IIB [Atopobiaceae bacterium]
MAEPDIVFARVDNRLVHGQVGASWVGAVRANLIIVADDEAANDQVQQSLMKMTADANDVGIRFFTLQKTIDVIHKASASQHMFIVARTPQNMLSLIEGGVPIKEVNIGNMHASGDKRVFHEQHVYVDDADLKAFAAMKAKGVNVFIQIAPTNKKFENLDFSTE